MLANFDALPLDKRNLIERHLDLVIETNKSLNLTRIDSKADGMLLHVEDSLCGLPELNEAPEGLYADLGSGAGFPGIPLSIASQRQTVLVDARMKKMQAVEKMIEELALSNQIGVFAGRAELLAQKQAGKFSVLTARALAKLSVLMELASPLLKKGGILICYKANVDDIELQHALNIQDMVGMTLLSDRSFTLGNEYTRRILAFKKDKKPKIRLPRQEGAAQKNPL